jgi:DNA-binding GntR family transcriptional regulator
MRSDIQQGRCTVPALKDMLEKNLSENYGVSRDVARRARNAVLSEFGEN